MRLVIKQETGSLDDKVPGVDTIVFNIMAPSRMSDDNGLDASSVHQRFSSSLSTTSAVFRPP